MKAKWDTKRFEECLDKIGYPNKVQRRNFQETGKFPIISQESDFINGYWDDKDDVLRVDRPLVVFGDHTQVLKYVDFDFVLGADGVKLLKPKTFIDPKFFYYFLMAHPIEGAGYARHYRFLKKLAVSYPPLSDQQRIVAVLDEAFAGLGTVTANVEKNLKNARELFESYLNSIFGQSLEMQALGDISENLDSRRIPVTKSDRKSGDIPYYGASGAVDSVDDFIFDEDLLLVSEDGANLVMRTYPIAFSIAGKSWVNNHAHVLRFPDLASQKFVEYYLNSISLMPYVNGMAQPKLNQKALNSIPVPWPKQDEREKVVARIEELAAQTDRLRELYETRMSALTELKQSTLGKAFSGELPSSLSCASKEAAE